MGEIERKYFFDTYAFFEIIKQNLNYSNYLNVGVITTRLNLMELHYRILREVGKEEADFHFNRLLPFCVDFTDNEIKEANFFKLKNKKKRLSYVDCLGYILARRRNILFLTGDKEFENFKGVEFVK
ncbi:MAG: PIN domain-containing protein [Nanoarchaeota archaeon]